MPPGVMRGFRNVGQDEAYLMAILGGTDAGRVSWAPQVLEQARQTGLPVRCARQPHRQALEWQNSSLVVGKGERKQNPLCALLCRASRERRVLAARAGPGPALTHCESMCRMLFPLGFVRQGRYPILHLVPAATARTLNGLRHRP